MLSRIRRHLEFAMFRRKYIGAFVVFVNDIAVFAAASIVTALYTVAASDEQSFTIVFAPERYIPVADRHLEQPLHLSVEQLQMISTISSPSYQLSYDPDNANKDAPDDDHVQLLFRSLNTTTHGTT